MRSKIKNLILLFTIMIMLSGCVKYNATMTINKDKSMDVSITYAMNIKMLEEETLMSDEEIAKIKEKGYDVKDYSDDSNQGYTITKHFESIDKLSSKEDVSYDIANITGEENPIMFKVEKGFFSNKYTANFLFNGDDETDEDTDEIIADDELTDDEMIVGDELTDEEIIADDAYEVWDEGETNVDEDETDDFSDLEDQFDDYGLSEMEMKLTIILPNSSTNSNASTNVNNKELTWDLSSDFENAHFEFTMLNIANIIATAVVGILLIVLIVVIIVTKRKQKI